jgi:hypothetical protein
MIGTPSPLLRAVVIGCGRLVVTTLVISAAVLVIGLSPRPAVSLPLYARQTGQPCATCHTAFLELTPFGRRFKLGGYTLDGGDWKGPAVCRHVATDLYEYPGPAAGWRRARIWGQ